MINVGDLTVTNIGAWDRGEDLLQIDNIFTPQQCEMLIANAETTGFDDVDRGNACYGRVVGRIQMDGRPLQEWLWDRLKDIIPAEVDGKRVTGLNDHFRFSKYHKGQFFDIHRDGFNQDCHGNRSVLTLNIFLNDDFEGGETDFFYSNNRDDFRFSVKPQAGRGALFYSQQYHCGNEIESGFKYLIRTDVMVSDY